jgi:SAM-dependent methyltransferase
VSGTDRPQPRNGSGARDYKQLWDQAATVDARDAVLTNATDESFESTALDDVRRLLAHLRGSDTVLNIGCGIGRVDLHLAPHVAELWAIDISGQMIALARKRLKHLTNVHLLEIQDGDFLKAFADDRFDLVFSYLVLQHLEKEDAYRYMKEAYRVLKPGGTFVAQFPNLLSPEYTTAFLEGVTVPQRSHARVRPYTESEVQHELALLGFSVTDLQLAAGRDGNAEIYVSARKSSPS